jgi:hypothetical protein
VAAWDITGISAATGGPRAARSAWPRSGAVNQRNVAENRAERTRPESRRVQGVSRMRIVLSARSADAGRMLPVRLVWSPGRDSSRAGRLSCGLSGPRGESGRKPAHNSTRCTNPTRCTAGAAAVTPGVHGHRSPPAAPLPAACSRPARIRRRPPRHAENTRCSGTCPNRREIYRADRLARLLREGSRLRGRGRGNHRGAVHAAGRLHRDLAEALRARALGRLLLTLQERGHSHHR